MKGGRAPGLDGLSVEFFKAFWPELGQDLLGVVAESLTENSLPLSCRRAVLTLLPKAGDLWDIKNWRPVSLLCTDYKILSKALANRLREVMDQVVHRDQTYCVPGRLITDNVILIRDVLDLSGSLGIDLGLISLDQEKAFDRVEHPYLWKTLERFGLSPGLTAMIKVLYQDIESVLKVNGELSAPFKVQRGIRQGCSLSGMLYALSIEPLLCQVRSSISGLVLPNCTAHPVLSAYADDVVVLVKSQTEIRTLEDIVTAFGNVSSAKVNWHKSAALAVGRWRGGLPTLPGGLTWQRGEFKYLGVHLGNEESVNRNWAGVVEKVEGRLQKWRWLLPQMSYRGRALVINNLVASGLWHRLACVDPPVDLLKRVQSIIVNFFWDHLHWVPQCVLFLPKDQGGQGLIHLSSRVSAFRLQFVQRFLSGPEDVVWRPVASAILRKADALHLDSALFLLDPASFDDSALPVFYRSVFRSWRLFGWRRLEPSVSLHWLLAEPLLCGARLDVHDGSTPGLAPALLSSGLTTLKRLVHVAGPDLGNAPAVASALGLRSARVSERILGLVLSRLSADEQQMLQDYCSGVESPDERDPFPELGFTLDFRDSTRCFDLYTVPGKILYACCVVELHRVQLGVRADTVWRRRLSHAVGLHPTWRVLYKPPLNKRTGDLQWRILHGAIAVNSFTSRINPEVSCACVHCGLPETVFHCFMDCDRLRELFELLTVLFEGFSETWTTTVFIFGAGYRRADATKWQLLNFLSGQAKLAIYRTRKAEGQEVTSVFRALVRARLWLDFKFYKFMNNLPGFVQQWCYDNVLCSVVEDDLVFNTVL
uniref:Reverse transcriptase domain-containing protein n=1 Tax=Anabas testudineus TaxID=64144 RepID=A0AAQ6ILA1_ANATE